jgi:hypothetical protein
MSVEELYSIEKVSSKLILLGNDLKIDESNSRNRRKAAVIYGKGESAFICSNDGFDLRRREVEILIKYLQNGLDNYSEEQEAQEVQDEVDYFKDMYAENEKYALPEKKKGIGYVYVLKGENGRYKIGYSKNVNKRINTLCVSSCEDHKLVFFYEVEDPSTEEKKLHNLMGSKRLHSEWFNLNDEDIQIIEAHLSGISIKGKNNE